MISIRGATTIEGNIDKEIEEKSIELFTEIVKINNLDVNKIHTIIFSCTEDIDKGYPGAYIRKHFNLNTVSIMHYNEMKVEGAIKLCIRVLILSNEEKSSVNFVYLHHAKNLRKDINN